MCIRDRIRRQVHTILGGTGKGNTAAAVYPAIDAQGNVYVAFSEMCIRDRFIFLTGVTKFAQVSVFSDLNQLNDISCLLYTS